jgi:hypothetical protein
MLQARRIHSDLLHDPDLQSTELVAKGRAAGRARGGDSRPPRGTLILHLSRRRTGHKVTGRARKNLIVSTTHNNPGDERVAIREVAPPVPTTAGPLTEGLLNHIEVAGARIRPVPVVRDTMRSARCRSRWQVCLGRRSDPWPARDRADDRRAQTLVFAGQPEPR